MIAIGMSVGSETAIVGVGTAVWGGEGGGVLIGPQPLVSIMLRMIVKKNQRDTDFIPDL